MTQRANYYNDLSKGKLPDHLGISMVHVDQTGVRASMEVMPEHLATNGYLHAASVVALADTACGYGCMALLPEGASSFTTIELKSNHLGTAREGSVSCIATPVHLGKTTQVWDAEVINDSTGKRIAMFRCTQMVLYPKPSS